MSSASVYSNKREKGIPELEQELEAIVAMNSSLRAYLKHLQVFKSNLLATHNNYNKLATVNSQWVDLLKK